MIKMLDFWPFLTNRRRLQLLITLLIMIACGLTELFTLGAVVPFISILTDPGKLWKQPQLQKAAIELGMSSPTDLILPFVLLFVAGVIFASVIRLVSLWLNGYIAALIGSDLSCRVFQNVILQDYQIHLKTKSSSVISSATLEIERTVAAFTSFLNTITATIIATALLTGLLLIDYKAALFTLLAVGMVYFLIYRTTRKVLVANGRRIASFNRMRILKIEETLGGIKEIILLSNQKHHIQEYVRYDYPQRILEASNHFLGSFPRFAIEGVAILGLVVVAGLNSNVTNENLNAITILGAFAIGAQRLLPSLQTIYSGKTTLKAYKADVDSILKSLKRNNNMEYYSNNLHSPIQHGVIHLRVDWFKYSSQHQNTLEGIDIRINKGDRIGIVGQSGSGKSTVADMLMGLIPPGLGFLKVDNLDLYQPENANSLASWRRSISHVPQTIYISYNTILENIAYGVPSDEIDFDRAVLSAKQAQIHPYICSLEDGYYSKIGKGGAILSGGQRQRIGIARALYRAPFLLVLDEPTSALDAMTEMQVYDSLLNLDTELTIVLITHKMSLLNITDLVIEMNQGKIIRQFTPAKEDTRQN
jgi:ABC-type bacteriocin/lantibiotic exporter with double-glycine peptidase domain